MTITKAKVLDRLSCDDLSFSRKDQTFTARWGFFYRHGKDAKYCEASLLRDLPEATVLDSGEVWKNFNGGASTRASSHWWVRFSLKEKS